MTMRNGKAMLRLCWLVIDHVDGGQSLHGPWEEIDEAREVVHEQLHELEIGDRWFIVRPLEVGENVYV